MNKSTSKTASVNETSTSSVKAETSNSNSAENIHEETTKGFDQDDLMERNAKIIDRVSKILDQSSPNLPELTELVGQTKNVIALFNNETKELKLKNKSIPREVRGLLVAVSKITPEEKRANLSRIRQIEADQVLRKDLLDRIIKRQKEVALREQKEYKLKKISNNAKSQRYIQKSGGFIGKKFTKAFNLALAETSDIEIKSDLINLQKLVLNESDLQNSIFDKQLETILDKIDDELSAFYSHDLKKPLRDSIISVLKIWNPAVQLELPEINFRREETVDENAGSVTEPTSGPMVRREGLFGEVK